MTTRGSPLDLLRLPALLSSHIVPRLLFDSCIFIMCKSLRICKNCASSVDES
jgi:hypothetical protein